MPRKTDGSQCRTCLCRSTSRNNLSLGFLCEYILLMGSSRPCEPSPNCLVYKKFNRQERADLEKNSLSKLGFYDIYRKGKVTR